MSASFDDVVTNFDTDVSDHLIILGCRHQYIRSDEGGQGVSIAQIVAVGGEPSKEVRTVGW